MTDKDGQSFVRHEADSIEMLLGSFAHAWGMGLQAWQALAGMGAGSQRDNAGATFVAPRGPQPRQAAAAQMADISPALGEACMIGAASAMRYWSALAELGLRYEASLVQTVADQTTGRSAAIAGGQQSVRGRVASLLAWGRRRRQPGSASPST